MTVVYRQCRYSGDILPVSEFTIDQWDCDEVCRAAPFGPKSAPQESSYSIRQGNDTTPTFDGGYDPADRPAWQALFDYIDTDASGDLSGDELVKALSAMIGDQAMSQIQRQVLMRGGLKYDDFIAVIHENLDCTMQDTIKRFATSLTSDNARGLLRQQSQAKINKSGSPSFGSPR
jgi:hypothetical protein